MTCPKCAQTNPPDARFCRSCGAKLTSPEGAPTVTDNGTPVSINDDGADSFEGQTLSGKYRLESILGEGGMGTVYVATRLHIGDTVAVKILHRQYTKDPSIAARFRREAQAAARLKHPNAVSIYDFGVTDDGASYLVMELVEGESLRQVIRKQGSLDPITTTEIIRQICAALEEAHRREIVHRDIKPDNIVLDSTPSGPRVKVLDFGIAKLRDLSLSQLTQTGTTMGTPQYMSPEQCLGQDVDSRSDIYSLGVVLFEMLCGGLPFNATTPMAMAVQQVNDPPPSLCARQPGVTPAIEAVVLHMLRKQPDARPQTAAAVYQELQAAVQQGTGPAFAVSTQIDFKPPTTSGRLQVSGTDPQISQPQLYSTPGPHTPVSSPAMQTVTGGGRTFLLLALGAIFLILLGIAAATGIYLFMQWQRANETQAHDPGNARTKPNANENKGLTLTPGATPNPTPSPSVSIEEELDLLKERRLDATKGQLPDIDEALQALEQKYPLDYRYTYERAKIANVGSHAHKEAFAVLYLAGQKAIDAGKGADMLRDLERDSDREFFELAHGHGEWKTLTEALGTNNRNKLRVQGR